MEHVVQVKTIKLNIHVAAYYKFTHILRVYHNLHLHCIQLLHLGCAHSQLTASTILPSHCSTNIVMLKDFQSNLIMVCSDNIAAVSKLSSIPLVLLSIKNIILIPIVTCCENAYFFCLFVI